MGNHKVFAVAITGTALRAVRLRQESVAWRLLRADNAPLILSVLGAHLGGANRRLSGPVLFEQVDQDLVELRPRLGLAETTGKGYCEEWTRQGYLVRRPEAQTREETFELSGGAQQALAFLASLVGRRQAVTESRLATILERIHDLAIATNPDAATRLAALEQRKQAIEQQIAQVVAGEFEPLPAERATERTRDILSLAEFLPADFTQVRTDIESINHDLRLRLIDDQSPRGSVLEDVFLGIDHLEGSEAGRSLVGFHDLINNPESSSTFDDDLDALLERPFAEALSPPERHLLRTMIPALQDLSREVMGVMTSLSRSLRRFVQSRGHEESSMVHRALREALRAAAAAAPAVAPISKVPVTLHLTSVPIRSVAALGLHNPAESRSAEVVTSVGTQVVDLAAVARLTRLSDIDFRELSRAVNRTLAKQGAATLAEVLQDSPPTQGVASVVGLMVLGEKHGTALEARSHITWRSPTGCERTGSAPNYLFDQPLPGQPAAVRSAS